MQDWGSEVIIISIMQMEDAVLPFGLFSPSNLHFF